MLVACRARDSAYSIRWKLRLISAPTYGSTRSRNLGDDESPTLLVVDNCGLLSHSTSSRTRAGRSHVICDLKLSVIVLNANLPVFASTEPSALGGGMPEMVNH